MKNYIDYHTSPTGQSLFSNNTFKLVNQPKITESKLRVMVDNYIAKYDNLYPRTNDSKIISIPESAHNGVDTIKEIYSLLDYIKCNEVQVKLICLYCPPYPIYSQDDREQDDFADKFVEAISRKCPHWDHQYIIHNHEDPNWDEKSLGLLLF